jgi:DNA-binding transcriptional LysR family regulator
MSIRLLRTLVAVAETDTFSAAAQRVNVTHAAVSQQMRALEADLGIALFDRSKRTPELTRTGQEVVERARRIISDYDALVPTVLGAEGLSGEIVLGVLPTTMTGLAPLGLARLRALWPDVSLRIRPGLTSALLSELQRGALDAALVSRPHAPPAGIALHTLAREPLELIAAPDTPGDDPLELLATRPFIRFSRDAVVGSLIENWLSARRLRVREVMELDGLEAIASMVHANLGVSIVPRRAIAPYEGAPVRALSLGPDGPWREVCLAHRADHARARVTDELLAAFQDVLAGTA